MAKISDKNRITNEEIEAIVDEFLRKLEILRVRYEQYFIGVEKVAPSVMRMDVVRIMRELEQIKVKNTALKFKIRQGIQKFTSGAERRGAVKEIELHKVKTPGVEHA